MDEVLKNNNKDKKYLVIKDITASHYVSEVSGGSMIITDAVSQDGQFNQIDLFKKELMDAFDNAKGAFVGAMVSFVIIELCGSFLTQKTGRKQGGKNFKKFCESDYMPLDYREISDLLYGIFRCGLVHSYILRGYGLIGENIVESVNHLKFSPKGLFVHTPTLKNDVKDGVEKLFNGLKENEFSIILEQLYDEGRKEYENFFKEHPGILKPNEKL